MVECWRLVTVGATHCLSHNFSIMRSSLLVPVLVATAKIFMNSFHERATALRNHNCRGAHRGVGVRVVTTQDLQEASMHELRVFDT